MQKKLQFLLCLSLLNGSCAPSPGGLSSNSSTGTGTDFSLTPVDNYIKYTSPSTMDQSYFGSAIAVGDFDGDELNDLASGVPYADLESNSNTGGVLIYMGTAIEGASSSLDTYDQLLQAPNTNNNEFGRALVAHDLNADGYDDLIVGSPGEEPSNRGAVYVFNGSSSGVSSSPSQILGEPNATASSGFGSALAVSDLDGDGYFELIVGANLDDTLAADAGAAWIYKGLSNGIFSSALATQITGASAAGDNFGSAIAIVDYNGDSKLDVIVGAPNDDGSAVDMGYFYAFYGTASSTTWVNSLTAADTSVANPSGVASDDFAFSLQAGDVTGDGLSDLIVGVPFADQYGTNQGLALVYEGIEENAVHDAMIPAAASSFNSTYSGYGVGLGDINNDGVVDIFLGTPLYSLTAYASGRIDVYYGSESGKVHFTEASLVFYPTVNKNGTYESYDDYFGWATCSGDLNGDGEDDLIVGSALDDAKWADEGMAYVYYSRPNGVYLNKPDVILSAGGYRATARQYGSSCLVMDFNLDGENDLLVGAQADDFGGGDGGAVFIHFGTGTSIEVSPSQAIIDVGDTSNGFGKSLATGDLNNDNFPDLVVGAYLDDTGGADRGIVYVYSSNTTTGIIATTPTNFQTVLANSDQFGYAVGVMDMNGDGDDDLLVGAIGDDTSAANSGRVVVYDNPGVANTLLDSTADTYIYHPTGAANSEFGSALGSGVYSVATYSDLFIGSIGDDTVFTDGGALYIYAGSVSGPNASSTQSINGLDGANSTSEGLGSAVSVFDFNQDGSGDIAIGAYADDHSGQNAGSVYIRVSD